MEEDGRTGARKQRRIVIAAFLVVGVALFASCMPPRHRANERCIFSDDCDRGLICAGGWCRIECRTDRDCTNMFRCVAAPEVDKHVCVPPDSPAFCVLHSDCIPPSCDPAAGCVPRELCAADNVCRLHCRAELDCNVYHPDMHCNVTTGVCSYPWEADGGVGP